MGRFRYVVLSKQKKKKKICLPISVYRTRGSREHGLGLGLGLGLEPSSLNFQKTSHLHQSSWAPRGPNDDFLFSLCATTQKMLFTEISQRHFEACIFRGICCKQKCATTLIRHTNKREVRGSIPGPSTFLFQSSVFPTAGGQHMTKRGRSDGPNL